MRVANVLGRWVLVVGIRGVGVWAVVLDRRVFGDAARAALIGEKVNSEAAWAL
ncbi:hypothetical protein ACFRIB_42550 [Streptomyces mirabilis]|uniref:hypothetical protein n=1 Tax=Streptomyces mirabilis TaxID=68239 RepID=UPI0036A86094